MSHPSVSLPRYIQISELLTREIAANFYTAGDRLPPEAELAKRLGVAVGTLRKSLLELESRGLLIRRQGSGTYINSSARSAVLQKNVYEFFRLELPCGGGLPTARILAFDIIQTPTPFRSAFTKQCYRLRRLRLLDGLPVALEEIYFEARRNAKLKKSDLGEALYVFYKERLGFWIASVQDRITQGFAPAWSPASLALPAGTACPRVERVARDGAGDIREYSVTWFDAAQCHYVNRMK